MRISGHRHAKLSQSWRQVTGVAVFCLTVAVVAPSASLGPRQISWPRNPHRSGLPDHRWGRLCFVNFKSAISAVRIRPRGLGFLPLRRWAYFIRAFLTL